MLENEISKRKKLSQNNTKILAKNTHWSVETQLSGKFTNIGKSVIVKQNKNKFKQKFFIKSFSSFSNLSHPVKPTLRFAVKISHPCNNEKYPVLQHFSHFVIKYLTSNRTTENFNNEINIVTYSFFFANAQSIYYSHIYNETDVKSRTKKVSGWKLCNRETVSVIEHGMWCVFNVYMCVYIDG